ncbi:uncharacterized protein LOC121252437 isoform X2 [Juglans microcarpa x Juglans regia]|uniref:uncharacterized protein LOC121252437 isoform X2 n=1 Tax=Juglans microcarpa x Juglans regia TaxID=2249226 RepID=UPI001B7E3574|nr:uncharacterized protein LOC121252437 isoform X2 [Juglans microcarpa x Juglans regia]
MQVIININPNRQEHSNKRDAGHVLPRHHDQEPKKSFVGWDQEYSSSTTKDQGKNNMGSEMKSMRKPGEESLVVKQEYLSDNVVERDTKPKPVVDNPTGYDPFLVGGDINQDALSSKEKKKGGRSTPYSDPSKNVVDSVARTSSLLEKEKKDTPKIMTATRLGPGVEPENVAAPTYSRGTRPVVPQTTQSHSENKTVIESFPPAIPSYEKEKKGMTAPAMRAPRNATMLSNEKSKDNAGKIQNTDPPKTTATHVGVQSKNESVTTSRSTSNQPQYGYQNTPFESIPQTPSFEKEKKDDGGGTQYSNASSKANATDRVEAGRYVANKDIGVPLVRTNKARGNNTSTTTGPYQKPKKGHKRTGGSAYGNARLNLYN